jgi:signal transduction histidine kinase
MNPRLRLALALAAVAAGLVNVALLLRGGDDRGESLAYLLITIVGVGWSFVGAGLVAWSRRPENRTGALMVAVGLAQLLNGLLFNGVILAREQLAFVLWFLLATLPEGVLGHLIAVFPDGRATTRLQRIFIIANYAATVPLALAQLLLVEPGRLGCTECPNDILGLGGRDRYGDVVLAASDLSLAVLTALLLWIVVTRWRQAAEPRRRSLAPVVLVGIVLLIVYMTGQTLKAVLPDPPLVLEVGFNLAILMALVLWPLAFLAGLARTRLDRSAVGDLAVQLGEALPPGRLEQVLACALHDPTLQLAYWLADRDAFVDAAGHPVELPAAGGDRAVTILRHDGAPVAAMLHDAALDDDPALVRAVAATARMTIENERLQAEVRAQLEEVRASRARIVEFGDAERRRVERNLHDGAQQRLVSISLALGIARSQVGATSEQEMAVALDDAAAELRLALGELRELARGIHPVILSEAGLGPALVSLAERSPIPVTVTAVPPERLPSRVEETAYYVASEALANAAKHAHATSVSISARQLEGQLLVEVGDDGVGGADPDGSGLRGLADRVAALDGRLRVHSPDGKGTRITAELPCGS